VTEKAAAVTKDQAGTESEAMEVDNEATSRPNKTEEGADGSIKMEVEEGAGVSAKMEEDAIEIAKSPSTEAAPIDLSGISFILGDAAGAEYSSGHDFSHIYLFDRVFASVTLRAMAKVLEVSPFRVMVSSKHWRVWWGHGLRKIEPVGKLRVYTTGKECITVFVYINTDFFPGFPREDEEEDVVSPEKASAEGSGKEAAPGEEEAPSVEEAAVGAEATPQCEEAPPAEEAAPAKAAVPAEEAILAEMEQPTNQ